jgi:anti-sigma-K factor RskA
MNHEEHDELWNLLGKARQPKTRPFFAAKVMQAIREEEEQGAKAGGIWMTVRRWWHVSFATAAAVAVAVFLALPSNTSKTGNGPEVAQTSADPLAPLIVAVDDADELGATLDNLFATQDNALWLGADPNSQ